MTIQYTGTEEIPAPRQVTQILQVWTLIPGATFDLYDGAAEKLLRQFPDLLAVAS